MFFYSGEESFLLRYNGTLKKGVNIASISEEGG